VGDIAMEKLFDSLCTLPPAQIALLNQEAIDACYDRRECHELGINYADIRVRDVRRALIYRAYANDFVPSEGSG
jgi:hypothetical protein